MKLISQKEIIDVVRYGDNAAIIVEKKTMLDPSQYKVSYSIVNFSEKNIDVVTKSAYLLKKFGAAFQAISGTIPNFVQCEAAILYDRRVLAVYPNGEAGIFDREGKLIWSGFFKYHDQAIKCAALDGQYFWSVCPNENCVIRFSCQNMKVDLRIGSKEANTFISPCHICFDGGNLYVCCNSNKVRMINGSNYTASDYMAFREKISRFYKFGNYAIAVLDSGTYLIDLFE